MKKEKLLVHLILLLFTIITTYRISTITIIDKEKKREIYEIRTTTLFNGSTARRGRILDTNGKVIVDNIGVNTLLFNGLGISTSNYPSIALKIASLIEIDTSKIGVLTLKNYYIVTHNNGNDLITKDEYKLLSERKLSSSDINALKFSRVTDEMINSMSEEEKKASYIYNKMNSDYYYQDKVIKSHLTDMEVASINEENIDGVSITLRWERTYPYGDLMISVLGGINVVPAENKDYYLKKGYKLNSIVGVSGLELEYDDYLRGVDAEYEINEIGKKQLVSEEKSGSDLYLSIDIELERLLYDTMKHAISGASTIENGEFFNHAYAIVGHPKTGEIVAMLGLLLENDRFIDITTNAIMSSYTVGSIVKGGSISVGYENNLITPGEYVLDSCVKVYSVQEKCSYLSLGYVNDIDALAMSSNYYQFIIAAHLANPNYYYNSHLNAAKKHFDIYRDMFESFGLGAITGIDLPNERTGIKGSTISDDLLLNLAIGQYDTYTPIEVFQYINTIANNGYRLKPTLMKRIVGDDTIINKPSILNEANVHKDYLNRIRLGFKAAVDKGTAWYFGITNNGAGKTGTSETFVDSDNDGKMDTATISNALITFAPFDDPEYSTVVIAPNIIKDDSTNLYRYPFIPEINATIYAYLFENIE